MRVATYTRISTDEDHQPYSLDAQADRLGNYVASQDGWELVRRFTDQKPQGQLPSAPVSSGPSPKPRPDGSTFSSSTGWTALLVPFGTWPSSWRNWTASAWRFARPPSPSTPPRQPGA